MRDKVQLKLFLNKLYGVNALNLNYQKEIIPFPLRNSKHFIYQDTDSILCSLSSDELNEAKRINKIIKKYNEARLEECI